MVADMRLGAVGIGDLNLTCGANPCGFLDFFSPSSDCGTWQQCAAAYNAGAPTAEPPCIPGGIDANGNTIVSCGGTSTVPSVVDWSNPSAIVKAGDTLPTGDTYAGPTTTVAQVQADLHVGNVVPTQVGTTPYLILGVVVFALMMIGGRR
jgi:hypothetical protein